MLRLAYIPCKKLTPDVCDFEFLKELRPIQSVDEAEALNCDFVFYDDDGLSLQRLQDGMVLKIDFNHGKLLYRSQRIGKDSELLLKAVSASQGRVVVDATGGVGRDAYIMACAGCRIDVCERVPIIYQLLRDALQRELAGFSANIDLHQVDSLKYISALEPPPEVIYLDPMFPERKKSAAVKKELQVLQCLADEDDSQLEPLLASAIAAAKNRVVVKRPVKAPELPGPAPTYQLSNKSIRFDIYVNRSF